MAHFAVSPKMQGLLRSGAVLAAAVCLIFISGCSSVPGSQSTSLPHEPSSAPTSTPAPTPSDKVAEFYDDGVNVLMLVNGTHALPEDYNIELTELGNGQKIAAVLSDPLQEMFDDMRAQGVYPIVASGYRTPEKQQSLMDEKVEELRAEGLSQDDAIKEARSWVNPVGHSEHQSGLAVDINADGIHSAGYEVYDWLAEHAWDYGFILRYPKNKERITSTSYEPWHYRYVGVEAAREIRDSGLTLEEYLGQS